MWLKGRRALLWCINERGWPWWSALILVFRPVELWIELCVTVSGHKHRLVLCEFWWCIHDHEVFPGNRTTSTIPSPEWSDLWPTAVRITKLTRLGWIRECLKAEWRCGGAICRCVVLISSVFISSVPAEMETFQHVGSHSVLNACADQVHLSVQNSCFEFALDMPLIVCCTEGHVKALMTLTFCKNYC